MNCVIIDDEPLARECIANYIREVDFLHLVGTGNNPLVLTQLLDQHTVDLVFLDIQMPIINGIDFLRATDKLPSVIITTAFPSYALDGFQLNVLDYLLKPITFNRFFQAVSKAKNQFRLSQNSVIADTTDDYFFVRCDGRYEKIFRQDILFVQALQNYVSIQTTKGKFMTLLYLKDVEQKLDNTHFIRVHKSFIVAIDKVEAVEAHQIIIQSHRIPISRNHRETVINNIVDSRLWKK